VSATLDHTALVGVVGGGIVGLSTAMVLAESGVGPLAVLEAEPGIARHQSSHNSGVIHSGLYYKPTSLKARTCIEGRNALFAFCAEEKVAHRRCGKLVVATHRSELSMLEQLEARGRANGLRELRRVGPDELRQLEPELVGVAALWVGETGAVDYSEVATAYARRVLTAGGEILTGAPLTAVRRDGNGLVLETGRGPCRVRLLVNCAGLHSDHVARMCGPDPGVRIIPFRGEYYELRPERRGLVRNLVYPVPDPTLPFLGVHFTRTIHERVEAGPNAVLAFRREGYRLRDVSARELAETLAFPGFWRMARKHWRNGAAELGRSVSKRLFVRALQRLVPAIQCDDVEFMGSGVRAQAVDRSGRLLDDFCIVEGEHSVHVLNAPSPAATASMSIGKTVADLVTRRLRR